MDGMIFSEPNLPLRRRSARFRDRAEAGALLAKRLAKTPLVRPLLLALPRGGVPVGYEIARRLDIPMDVLIARKIGAPDNLEFAIGAIVEGGLFQLNAEAVTSRALSEDTMNRLIEAENTEIGRRIRAYRGDRPLPAIEGRDVVLVDDGIATGETARVACRFLRAAGARSILLAVPVCPARTHFPEVDALVAMRRPSDFHAVGQFYTYFSPVPDDDIVRLLDRARSFGSHPGTTREIVRG